MTVGHGGRLGYVAALNGVRGVAIVAVLGYHFFGLPGGIYGVDLFFVLSGFLITTLLLEEHQLTGTISLRRFYGRRARRLVPALGVLLLFVAMLGTFVYTPRELIEIVGSGVFYITNLVAASGHRDLIARTAVDHLWSLAEEEQFYLLWPPLLLLLLRRVRESALLRPLIAVFVLLVAYRMILVGAGASSDRVLYGPDTHADGLVIGVAAAVARRRGVTVGTAAALAGAAVLVATFIGAPILAGLSLGLPLFELASAGLVLACVRPGAVAAGVLSWRPVVWLGSVSYSLYLWHQFARWFFGWTHPWAALALTVPLALGSYYLIERPFRGRRVKPAAVPTPALATG